MCTDIHTCSSQERENQLKSTNPQHYNCVVSPSTIQIQYKYNKALNQSKRNQNRLLFQICVYIGFAIFVVILYGKPCLLGIALLWNAPRSFVLQHTIGCLEAHHQASMANKGGSIAIQPKKGSIARAI